jgi:hyperosmotically inducible periplasmic protein
MRHAVLAPLVLVLTSAALVGCRQEKDRDDRDLDTNRPVTTNRDGVDAAKPVDADNTGRNVRDRDDMTKTPGDQTENEADVNRTAEIRRRITDTQLSVNAKNVKIVTVNGRVTLRGPVASQAEKDQVVRIAREIAGDANVDDQLEIALDK